MLDPVVGEIAGSARTLLRGVIADVVDESRLLVRVTIGDEDRVVVAERLFSSDVPLRLAHGDAVLCCAEAGNTDHLLVLGRIGPASGAVSSSQTSVPDELLLEAKHSLTLRVGEGSITIREDGKILIKGKDLVSHAQRMNRIKGGAVSIN